MTAVEVLHSEAPPTDHCPSRGAATPIPPCQCCGAPRRVEVMPDSGDLIATCDTWLCDLEAVTLNPFVVLAAEQVADYAHVNQRFRESRARFVSREAGRWMGAKS